MGKVSDEPASAVSKLTLCCSSSEADCRVQANQSAHVSTSESGRSLGRPIRTILREICYLTVIKRDGKKGESKHKTARKVNCRRKSATRTNQRCIPFEICTKRPRLQMRMIESSLQSIPGPNPFQRCPIKVSKLQTHQHSNIPVCLNGCVYISRCRAPSACRAYCRTT